MCGRYYIADEDSAAELKAIVDEVQRKNSGETIKTGEIFPTDTVPVIANNRALEPRPFAMKWGYTMQGKAPIINARSETAADKAMFKDGMAQRRCLIPASNYFEWEKRGKDKIKYAIRPSESDMLYMAGIYRVEFGKPVFTILTRDPAESIAFIHNRMPVILPAEATHDWLNPRYAAGDVLNAAILNVHFEIA